MLEQMIDFGGWGTAMTWLLAWLLTYLMHSTFALLAVWLLCRWLDDRFLAAKEALWKFGILAGIVTASVQVSGVLAPISGQWQLADTSSTAPSAPPAALPETFAGPIHGKEEEFDGAEAPHPADFGRESVADADRGDEHEASFAPAPVSEPSRPFRSPGQANRFAAAPVSGTPRWIGGWFIGSVLVLLIVAGGWLHFRMWLLRGSQPITSGDLVAFLERLSRRANLGCRIRLYASPGLASPVVFGIWRPVICVPTRFLRELSAPAQECALAHEVAHLVRWDPLWLTLFVAVERIFFFQPLNYLARHRWQETAEYLCDSWVVTQTGRPVDLAKCLMDVAEWVIASRRVAPVCGMAQRNSPLGNRIRRLLEHHRPEGRFLGRFLPLAVGLLVGVLVGCPGFTVPAAAPDQAEGDREPTVARERIPDETFDREGEEREPRLRPRWERPEPWERDLAELDALQGEFDALALEITALKQILQEMPDVDPESVQMLEKLESQLERLDTRRRELVRRMRPGEL